MDKNEILKKAKEYIAEEKDEAFRKEVEDLLAKSSDEAAYKELEDRFYQSLEFGTGGLRGVMGGGTNRMNTLNISKATQGLASYIIKAFPAEAKAGTISPSTIITTSAIVISFFISQYLPFKSGPSPGRLSFVLSARHFVQALIHTDQKEGAAVNRQKFFSSIICQV